MKKQVILIGMALLFCANAFAAIDWDIYGGTESISGGDEYGIVNVFNSAELDVLGGAVDRIFGYNQSTIEISGGTINILEGYDESTFDLWGGSVDIISVPVSTTVFNVYGKNLAISGSFVEGDWINGESFSIELRGGHVINLHEIPEPVTLTLFGLGGLLIRRKK